ncbi:MULTISPECIES: hypothetical protein [unclassified Streptomyces]|uniref:hypothetical protein n=1 Tax=unclassified Streptomyces TaxID=2593676 RepID=UPI000B167AB2|nr:MULTISPECIES: hypothetical protein [unclassified Streptomyces]
MATRGPVKARPWTWIWASVAMTVVCGGPLALVAWGAAAWDGAGGAKPADCSEVMTFARGTLPADARDARCTGAHWQESRVVAEFRTDRAGAGSWLSATYPDGVAPSSCARDVCRSVEYGEVLSVRVSIAYEDGETALVRVEAFDH